MSTLINGFAIISSCLLLGAFVLHVMDRNQDKRLYGLYRGSVDFVLSVGAVDEIYLVNDSEISDRWLIKEDRYLKWHDVIFKYRPSRYSRKIESLRLRVSTKAYDVYIYNCGEEQQLQFLKAFVVGDLGRSIHIKPVSWRDVDPRVRVKLRTDLSKVV